jgi:hypothetical protein
MNLSRQYAFAAVSTQVFRADKNCLGINLFWRKKELFFETAEAIPPNIAVKCLGTRCESGTVAPL